MKGFINDSLELTTTINNINQKVDSLQVLNLIDCISVSKIDYTIIERTISGNMVELICKQDGNTWQAKLKIEVRVKGKEIETSFKWLGKSQTTLNTLKMLFNVHFSDLNSYDREKLVKQLSRPLTVDEIYKHECLALWHEKLVELEKVGVPTEDLPDFETYMGKYFKTLPESKKPIYGKTEIKEDSTKDLKVKREKVKREKKLINSIEDLKEVQDELAGKQVEVSNV